MYNDAPVTLIFLIRNDGDGTRLTMGNYFATQMEAVGFTIERQEKKSSELSPLWIALNPVTVCGVCTPPVGAPVA
jgi:hypothetical protein